MKNELTHEHDGPLSPARRQARCRIRRAEKRAEQAVLDAAAEAERIVEEEQERARLANAERDQRMDLLVLEVMADVMSHPDFWPTDEAKKLAHKAYAEVGRRLEEVMPLDEAKRRFKARTDRIRADRRARKERIGSGSSGHAGSTPADTPVTLANRIGVTPDRIADPQRDGHAEPVDDGVLGGVFTTHVELPRTGGGALAFLRSPANQNADEDDEEGGLADHLAAEEYRAHDPDPDYEAMVYEAFGADKNGYIR